MIINNTMNLSTEDEQGSFQHCQFLYSPFWSIWSFLFLSGTIVVTHGMLIVVQNHCHLLQGFIRVTSACLCPSSGCLVSDRWCYNIIACCVSVSLNGFRCTVCKYCIRDIRWICLCTVPKILCSQQTWSKERLFCYVVKWHVILFNSGGCRTSYIGH